MDFRPILFIIGILLLILAASMSIPLFVDMHFNNPDWKIFFLCIVCTGFFGGAMILSNASQVTHLSIRQAFLLTTLSWVTLSAFSAVPLWLSNLNISFTDAFFEAVSGITTTGSTILTGLDTMPPGILLWRAILQWLGGIGIIVMAIAVLPFLKVGGMQLFRTESSEHEKALPRATQMTAHLFLAYCLLSLACAVLYVLGGMSVFDAFIHSMTTLSTGGFSTYDSNFGAFDSTYLRMVAVVFMISGALPFVLYLKLLRGHASPLFHDPQVRFFLGFLFFFVVILAINLHFQNMVPFGKALESTAFTVTSIITGTGYTNTDYNMWGGFAVSILFFVTVVGGCSGSASCGLKIFRVQILYEVCRIQIKQLLYPNGIFIPHYNGKPLPPGVPIAVVGFFFVFALTFTVVAVTLSFFGLDFLTAMSAAATTLANVGPGLGNIVGPVGNFQSLGDLSKWVLVISMLMGRLELFTVLILFSPAFWRR